MPFPAAFHIPRDWDLQSHHFHETPSVKMEADDHQTGGDKIAMSPHVKTPKVAGESEVRTVSKFGNVFFMRVDAYCSLLIFLRFGVGV